MTGALLNTYQPAAFDRFTDSRVGVRRQGFFVGLVCVDIRQGKWLSYGQLVIIIDR